MTTEERTIQDIVEQLETAWNKSDSKGFASLFVEDANFIQIFGGQLDGRTAIEAAHRHIFDTIYKGSHIDWALRTIRTISPDVAVVFTKATVKFFEGGESREIVTRPTLIVTMHSGQWRIVAFQNTRISEVPRAAEAAARLAT